MCIGIYVKYSSLLLNFLDRFWINIEILIFMKIFPVGTEWFHTDGRM